MPDGTERVANYLEDAAHYPGGHAAGIVFPRTADEVAQALAAHGAILPIGAQSSLTGGATPMGETVLATSRLRRILDVSRERITVEPGVTVAEMQQALRAAGAWFPPAPTYTGACAGGIVATNAAGAATFKYGSTRAWVEAITVVLAAGHVVEIVRGDTRASGGVLEMPAGGRTVRIPVPGYRMPAVQKTSAGYFSAADMDLIDLFIGSEGTLGVVTRITFRAASPIPPTAFVLVPCRGEAAALGLVADLRRQALATWRQRGDGIDIAAIEHMDRRSIEIVREDGADRRHAVTIPADTGVVLLVQLELPEDMTDESAFREIQESTGIAATATPLGRFCRLLDEHGLLEASEIALPGQQRRIADLLAVREAVPAGVNQRVGAAKRDVDGRIEKTAADMIVPFERFGTMMERYREGFSRRGLDFAVWGHISDGNVHPNVIPRSWEDVVHGKEAILEFGGQVVALGGSPLAEHGVGRNRVKQELLRRLYGQAGIDEMRRVKRALDPGWKLSPGVLFPRQEPHDGTD